MTPVAPPRRASVTVHADDATVLLSLTGTLDRAAGDALVDAASAALDTAPERIDIDLRQLDGWTDAGVSALVRCREVCAELPGGLHYRTGRGPGREALLAAYR
jgi:ABC-type transporter Mla MlaB component